jgi:UDP-N-acetylglucosamine acyltransferase
VVIGGAGGVHQFCRVGAHAMLSAMAKLVQDLPPFFIADGTPALVRAYNKVGLERRGYTSEQLERVRSIYRVLYRDGLNRSQALDKLRAHVNAETEEYKLVLAFAEKSERGIVPGAT